MSSEFKVMLYAIAAVISFSLIVAVAGGRSEVTRFEYKETLELKSRMELDPTNKGWDKHRQWLKTSMEDGLISTNEYHSLLNLNRQIRKQNLLYSLSK